MSWPRILPDAQGLQALADAFPGITQTELAKIIGCNASYLGTALEKAGIELRHGRRTNSQHYTLVQTRKIPPARGENEPAVHFVRLQVLERGSGQSHVRSLSPGQVDRMANHLGAAGPTHRSAS